MSTPTDADEDEDFDPAALTPAEELPHPSSSPQQWLTPGDGEVWGDYRLGEMLGQGGMGMVFKAHQLSLNRAVALKVLTPYLGQSASFRNRFLREAQSVARIASPHVVQVFAAGTHREFHYFAMEYVDGEDLGGKLARGYRPSRAEALDIITQAARGLVAAGEHDIVHRDIKPGNMMVTRKGVVKLMDFGLVRIASEDRMTTTGVVMGTPYYFSPEQARGEDTDQRADIYSLGIVFYELLTGELPFTGDAQAVVYAHVNTRPRRPRDLDGEIPIEWQEVVLACLAKKPEARYRAAAELVRDLERLAADQAPALVAPPGNPWPVRAAAVATIVAAITASAYAVRPPAMPRTVAGALPLAMPAASAIAASSSAAPSAASEPEPSPMPANEAVPPPPAPVEEPTALLDTPTIIVPCETTVALRAPFRGGRFVSYRWRVEGPHGASGRLDAAATVSDENAWTAPGRRGITATVLVVGRAVDGRDYSAPLRLATAEVDFTQRHLQVFAHWSALEPAATRPDQDAQGRWWACDAAARRLRVISADWLREEVFDYAGEGAYAPPAAVRAQGDEVVALDAAAGLALAFDAHGALQRRIAVGATTASDLLVTAGGRLVLADPTRGLRALARDGHESASAARGVRLAQEPAGGLVALDPDGTRVQRLDAALNALGELTIPLRGDERAIDIAVHPEGVLALLSSGAVAILDAAGTAPRRLERADLIAPRGRPGALALGAGGEALVTWPGDGVISRLPLGGWTAAMRGGAARRASACACDAAGRLWSLSADGAVLADAQGWCIARVAAAGGGVAQPEQLAVSPDGERLALAGPRCVAVIDLTQSPPAVRAVAPPRGGRWPGAPQLALDDSHRLYVLDADLRRVSVVDDGGAAMGFACAKLKHPSRLAVSPGGTVVYVAEADGSAIGQYVFDRETHSRIDHDGHVAVTDLGVLRADALGCDYQGQLYLLDEGRRLRVWSWQYDPPAAVSLATLSDLGVGDARAMGVSPDGQVWLCGTDGLTGLRW